jgi:hypothetical protein
MFKFVKSLFSKGSSTEFSVEIRSKREPKTRWDEISEMDIPSSEKIKLVEIQSNPLADSETIEAERKSKCYTITVIPQAKDCFEYDESQKITVYVLAGSKEEAIDTLSKKLSGKYGFSSDSNSNTATAGRWYDGNMYSLEITSFEKSEK